MTRQEHLLIILAEECAEVAHRCSKALRFGLGDVAPGQALTNAQAIEREMCHLYTVAGLMREEDIIGPWIDTDVVRAKLAAVELWLEHSRKQGTLTV